MARLFLRLGRSASATRSLPTHERPSSQSTRCSVSGSEVDFVVYGRDGFWAFEVKNAQRVQPPDVRGAPAVW